MSFVFKNKELGDWVYSFLDKSSVQKQIEQQWGDGLGAIALSTSEGKFFCETQDGFFGSRALLTISKKELLHSLDYKPDQWNPFPQTTPPKDDAYLVTVKYGEYGAQTIIDSYRSDMERWYGYENEAVLAFRAIPKPYVQTKEEEEIW